MSAKTDSLKEYIITWHEDREAVVFAMSENEAMLKSVGMNGRWVKRDQYMAKEA